MTNNSTDADKQRQNTHKIACLASILMGLAVLLGAFGAHGLKSFTANPHQLQLWQTATLYFFIHNFALFIVALAYHIGLADKKQLIAFLLGIVLFCGSLYAMALGAPRMLGMITPIGGLCFMAGWLMLARQFIKSIKPT